MCYTIIIIFRPQSRNSWMNSTGMIPIIYGMKTSYQGRNHVLILVRYGNVTHHHQWEEKPWESLLRFSCTNSVGMMPKLYGNFSLSSGSQLSSKVHGNDSHGIWWGFFLPLMMGIIPVEFIHEVRDCSPNSIGIILVDFGGRFQRVRTQSLQEDLPLLTHLKLC